MVSFGFAEYKTAVEEAGENYLGQLYRKTEVLGVIGAIAPMLGLMGTVWGMILAFLEFETKANPQVSELAPGIYKALVTTLMGLGVAVPAVASFGIFRNRVDGLVAEASLLAEHVFADYKRSIVAGRRGRKPAPTSPPGGGGVPPIVPERGPR